MVKKMNDWPMAEHAAHMPTFFRLEEGEGEGGGGGGGGGGWGEGQQLGFR